MKCKKCGNEGTFISHEEGNFCKLCGKLHPSPLQVHPASMGYTSATPEDFRTKVYEIPDDEFPSYEELKKELENERRAYNKLWDECKYWSDLYKKLLARGKNKQ